MDELLYLKQVITIHSSNHAKIHAIHEASRECVWLRSVTHHTQDTCGLSSGKNLPTILLKDNPTCIPQIK